MKNVDKDIRETAQMVDGERLNFGLVQVVYEWARDKVIERLQKSFQNSKII